MISDLSLKILKKNQIPKDIFDNIYTALSEVDKTKNLSLFDITEIIENSSITYYRIRNGKYRAIFYINNDDVIIDLICKREDIYKLWKP